MGAKRSSFFSFCNLFKACFSSREHDYYEENVSGRRIFRSDEVGHQWVAEPGIDGKATLFIDRFYARVSDSNN